MGSSPRQLWGKLVLLQAENAVVMESNQETHTALFSAVKFSQVSRNEEDRWPVCRPAPNKPVPQSND
jgi:hypothetical protein